jgi:nucleotide-binding universal stress UspA family protein
MKTLLPLDGSGESESALSCACKLVQRWGSQLILVQATEPFTGLQPPHWHELEESALAANLEYLKSLQERLGDPTVTIRSRMGSPKTLILEIAEAEQCQLIVMASHGRNGLGRWLVGSVAESVLRQSTCPVLLLRPPAPEVGEFHNVLVPVDDSQASREVLPRIQPFLANDAKVTLLRCSDFTAQQQQAVYQARDVDAVLDALAQDLGQVQVEGLSLHRKVLHSNASEGIVQHAREAGCDLIAMSSHGRSGWRRFLLGSVSERVARLAPCPVLIFAVGAQSITASIGYPALST